MAYNFNAGEGHCTKARLSKKCRLHKNKAQFCKAINTKIMQNTTLTYYIYASTYVSGWMATSMPENGIQSRRDSVKQ